MNHLSLTLRDSQHLCWKTYKKFQPKDTTSADILSVAADLEFKAHALKEKAGTDKPPAKEDLAELLSGILFSAFVAAEHAGVDLEDSFLQSIDNYILNSVK